jgi:hypothetical protein
MPCTLKSDRQIALFRAHVNKISPWNPIWIRRLSLESRRIWKAAPPPAAYFEFDF